MHKKWTVLLLLCIVSIINAMDVDKAPVSRKKKRASSNTESVQSPSSNASSALSDTFVLSDTQRKLFEKVVNDKTNTNHALYIACHLALLMNEKISKSDFSGDEQQKMNRLTKTLNALEKLTKASDPEQVQKQPCKKQKQ